MSARGGSSWRDVIADQVAVSAAETKGNRGGSGADIRLTHMHLSVEAHPFLVRAAQARGISISGYARRAVLAHVALDLGLEAVDLFKLDGRIAPLGSGGGSPLTSRDLDGQMYGRWEVEARGTADDGR